MKGIGHTIRSVFKRKSKKTSIATNPPNISTPGQTRLTPGTRIISRNNQKNSKHITISITTTDRGSNADTFNNSSIPATDSSLAPTISSRTSVTASSISANQRHEEDLAALGFAMKLPLQELSLIASDSNFFLASGEAIKEADFCDPQASVVTAQTSHPAHYWKRSEFDIFEQKRGPDDVVVPRCRNEGYIDSAAALRTPSPSPLLTSTSTHEIPSLASIYTPKTSSTVAKHGHPAFLSDAEFASLPHYEDIEGDITYDTYYEHPNYPFASVASLSSCITPTGGDESWMRQVKMGFDIGGELHFFKKGVKRGDGIVEMVDWNEKVAESEVKRRDCRVREKSIRGRFGMAMSTDEQDADWEEAFEDGYVFRTRNEAQWPTAEADSRTDNAVLMGILDCLGIAPQDVKDPGPADDGYGGYGKEIF